MATFYLDPEAGNDANDGTSFANRWKTFTSGATAARIAPGDIVRIMASRDPNSLGNATWTDNSATVTLAAQKTLNITTCDSAWTASANVTATTNSSINREGTACANLSVAAGFTTGKIAFFDLGSTIDFSTYEAVSFLIRASITVATTALELRLCSDASGVTSVLAIPVAYGLTSSSTLTSFLYDAGSALPNNVRSVALYALTDPGTVVLNLDNIIACRTRSHADHLSHQSVLGKNTVPEPEWYPIKAINGTAINLGVKSDTSSTITTVYRGTTETVTTYGRGTTLAMAATDSVIQDSGTSGTPITFSGGWDRTAMTTQSGETWFNGHNEITTGLNLNSKLFVKTEKLGFIRFTSAAINLTGTGCDVGFTGLVDNALTGTPVSSFRLKGANILWATDVIPAACFGATMRGEIDIDRISGAFTTQAVTIPASISRDKSLQNIRIGKMDNCTTGITIAQNAKFWLRGTTFNNYAGTDVTCTGELIGNRLLTSTTGTPITNSPTSPGVVRLTNFGGSFSDHRTLFSNVTFQTATDQIYSGSTVSWKITITTSNGLFGTVSPFYFPLGVAYCKANVNTTITVQVRRHVTDLTIGIGVLANEAAGVSASTDFAVGSIDTWEAVTLTFTPSADTAVQVYAIAYSDVAATYNGWWDALAAS
jgi:hypothetical protein